jgi:hypothetical protein
MNRRNEHGGLIIRQSDLSSWSRCNLQKHYLDQAKREPLAAQPQALSATVFGTVVHYALLTMEKLHHAKKPEALDIGIATFEHYWDPANISSVAEPVQIWIARQTYGGLRDRGRTLLRSYYELLQRDDGKLLALEYEFAVPLVVEGRQHTLTGTVDRLAVRKWYGTPYLSIEDFKTGKQPYYLRQHIQGTAYSYASTQPEFWSSDIYPSFDQATLDGIERFFAKMGYRLHDGTKRDWWSGPAKTEVTEVASRRFRWVNMQEIKYKDGGWRGPQDYSRLRLVVDAYVRAQEAGIFSPVLDGVVCQYCPFQRSCGGTGLPLADHGMPEKRYKTKR